MGDYYITISEWLENEHSIYELSKIYGDIRADLEDAMRNACNTVQDYYESQILISKVMQVSENPQESKCNE